MRSIELPPPRNLVSGVVFLVSILFLLHPAAAFAQVLSFQQIRSLLSEDGSFVVSDDILLQGIVASAPGNPNLEESWQRHYSSVNTRPNTRKAYIESKDGLFGFALDCEDDITARKMPRFSTVVLSLKGTTITRKGYPLRYTISGITEKHVLRVYPGDASRFPYKEKYYSELTDSDIYTYVVLKDSEFILKDGSWADIYETYSLKTTFNADAGPNGSMDGWASLLCDAKGSLYYILINDMTPWRRNGLSLPQGSGDIGGIIVYSPSVRYGGDVMGRYQLRPLFLDEVGIDYKGNSSNWKTLVEWNWNSSGDFWKPDVGKGKLTCNVTGSIYRGSDTNNTLVEPKEGPSLRGKKGMVSKGALTVQAPAREWWKWPSKEPCCITIDFSPQGAGASRLLFAFSFSGGYIKPSKSYGFPVYWEVDCRMDSGEWIRLGDDDFVLRSLPWWWGEQVEGVNYTTSLEAGMGMTQHAVLLPEETASAAKISLRIRPAKYNISSLAAEKSDNLVIRENIKDDCYVNFGSFVIRYQ